MMFFCAGRSRLDDDGKPLCDYKSTAYWRGRCPKCHMPYTPIKFGERATKARTTAATAASATAPKYVTTGVPHVDRVLGGALGGGLPRGAVVVFGGPQGSGKSSLCMMVCDGYQKATGRPVLYVSGEESTDAVISICARVGVTNDQIEVMGSQRSVHAIVARCEQIKPSLVVVDSIQEMSEHGDVTTTASENVVAAKILHEYCNKRKVAGIFINHLTGLLEYKGGTAIPHLVETEMLLYRFSADDDGNPYLLFGKPEELDELSSMRSRRRRRSAVDSIDLGFDVEKVRTLMVRKNRNGSEGRKAYFLMTEEGKLKPLEHNERKHGG